MTIRKEWVLWAILAVVGLLVYTWWKSRPRNPLQGSDDLISRLSQMGAAMGAGFGNPGIVPPMTIATGNVPG